MIEKGKVSTSQIALLIIPIIVSPYVVSPIFNWTHEGRDIWISTILGSFNGFLTGFIIYQLHKSYPTESVIQYSQHIIGRVPGKILGLLFLFFFLQTNGVMLRLYSDFVVASVLPQTPITLVAASMVFVCSLAVRGGAELLGRTAQILVPLFVLPPLLYTLLIQDLEMKNLFPIMEHGIMIPVLESFTPQAMFGGVFVITILLPFLRDHDKDKGAKRIMISLFIAMLILVFVEIVIILLLGKTVASYTYPIFTAFQYISIGDFFEHIESIIITIWVTGMFLTIAIFYYALVLGTAQWLNLSNYQPLVLPLGALLTIFSLYSASNRPELINFLGTGNTFFSLTIQFLIPLIMLLIVIIRKRIDLKRN